MNGKENTHGQPEKESTAKNSTPEMDYNRYRAQATDVIPDEVPRRDGPGGE